MNSDPPLVINLSGTVYQRNGGSTQALLGAPVRAVNEEDGITHERKTDANGRYTFTGLKSGRWKLSVSNPGFSVPPPIDAEFSKDRDSLNFEVEPVISVAGTLYEYGNGHRLPSAVVKATSEKGKTVVTVSDDDGDFTFPVLTPGKWQFVAMHEHSYPSKPQEIILQQDKRDLRFKLFRRVGEADEKAGRRFFVGLLVALAVLIVTYFLLHIFFPEAGDPVSRPLLALVLQAQEQAAEAETLNEDSELLATVADLNNMLDNVLAENGELSAAEKESINEIGVRLEESITADRQAEAVARLAALQRILEAPQPGGFGLWRGDPWRFLEVLSWALAGVLVNTIITSGSYLRWHNFYREGIVMHISHIVTVPLLVLVVVFLLSLVTLEITLAGGNEVQLDLSDPRILVAVAFILGSRPWTVWGYIQSAAERFTQREANDG